MHNYKCSGIISFTLNYIVKLVLSCAGNMMKVATYFIWEVTVQGCMAVLVSTKTVCTGADRNKLDGVGPVDNRPSTE